MYLGRSMARSPGGAQYLEQAKMLLKQARTADELRAALALVLPLEWGMSLEETARIIGRSVCTATLMRTRLCRQLAGQYQPDNRRKSELRNRAHSSLEDEARLLALIMQEARRMKVKRISALKPLLETRLGRPIALSTFYLMLERHGWNKAVRQAYLVAGSTD